MKFFVFTTFLLLTFATASFAQEKPDSIGEQHLHEVSVLSGRRPSSLLSSTPLQLVTQKDILNGGIRSLSDAVRRFNGVVLKDYGGVGGLKTISIRGMGTEHTAVSYDGVMINNIQSGQIDLGQFTLDNLSAISLNVGQSDNIFQTAKAFASVGVLNLETKTPVFDGKNYNLNVRLAGGSFGMFDPSLLYDQRLGRRNVLSVSGGWQRSDGMYPFTMKNGYTDYHSVRKNSDVNQFHAEMNLLTVLNKTSTLRTKVYYWGSQRGLPGAVDFQNDYSAERLWNKNFFAQLSYNKDFGKGFRFKSQAKFNYAYTRYMDVNDSYKPADPDGRRIDKFVEQETYWSNALLYKITHFQLSLAQDLYYDRLKNDLDGVAGGASYPVRYNSLTALAGRYSISRFSVNAALLGTFVKEEVTLDHSTHYYKRLSPMLSVMFSPLAHYDNFKIRAFYKDIYRIPTFTEAYYTRNLTKIRPEQASQFDVGVTFGTPQKEQQHRFLTFTGDVYYNKVKDKIIIQPSTFYSYTTNLGRVDIKGADLKLAGGLRLLKDLDLSVSGSYSYMQAQDVTDPAAANYKSQVMYTPVHSGSFVVGLLSNRWANLTYTVLMSGERYFWFQNLPEYHLDGYTDHSISVNRGFKVRHCAFVAQFTVSNLLNKNYQVLNGYPMAGRSFNGSLSCTF